MIHPVPPYGYDATRDKVFDRMEELGLWIMYDMRWYVGDFLVLSFSFYQSYSPSIQDVPERLSRSRASRLCQTPTQLAVVVHR